MRGTNRKRIGCIMLVITVTALLGRQVMAQTDSQGNAEDAVCVFLEQAFPVLTTEDDTIDAWADTMFPWSQENTDMKEDADAVVYDVPNVEAEIFQGYPQDEVVKEVVQPNVLSMDSVKDIKSGYSMSIIQNFSYLQNLYSYDSGDVIRTPQDLDGEKFMQYDFTTDLSGEDPVVLLFHTHGSEGYIDYEKHGVIEVGQYLKQILEEQYGIPVMHHTAIYDANGVSGAYEKVNEEVSQIIAANPSIQVAIDIHRDGIGGDGRLATTVNGKETAQVMLVNGLCKILDANGVMQTAYIAQNPYLEENLAFSFRMKMASDTMYEGWMRNMYLKAYRYSTHMLPKSLLLEVGAEGNTLQEAKNAMEPMAEVLVTVLTGNG